MNEREETDVEREFLLRNAPMRAKLSAPQRSEPFYGVHMHFTEPVATFISGIFVPAMVDTLMVIALIMLSLFSLDSALAHQFLQRAQFPWRIMEGSPEGGNDVLEAKHPITLQEALHDSQMRVAWKTVQQN